ncbi:MAG: PHP-associated domain-containing protein [Promethearchaeia archaeon]
MKKEKKLKQENRLHLSGSQIPPSNLVKIPIRKQNSVLNYIYKRVLSKYGLMQLVTYHKTRKRFPSSLFPYKPSSLTENTFLYDFHIHSRYSDGAATYKEILSDVARKKHLDGLAITDHPFHMGRDGKKRILDDKVLMRSYKFHELVEDFKERRKLPKHFISFPGSCEFFMRLSEEHPNDIIEIIAIGLPKDFIENYGGLKPIANSYAKEFIEKVHDANGLVILPHPFYMVRAHQILKNSKYSRYSCPDAVETINYTIGFMADKSYDGFFSQLPFPRQLKTIGSNFGYFNWIATVVSQKNEYGNSFDFPVARKIPNLGNSDAHFRNMVGAASTLTKRKISSLEDLRKVFQNKETIPVYNPLWSRTTKKSEVYREIWEIYGEDINSGLQEFSLYQWVLAKTLVDIFALIFN